MKNIIISFVVGFSLAIFISAQKPAPVCPLGSIQEVVRTIQIRPQRLFITNPTP